MFVTKGSRLASLASSTSIRSSISLSAKRACSSCPTRGPHTGSPIERKPQVVEQKRSYASVMDTVNSSTGTDVSTLLLSLSTLDTEDMEAH